MNGLSLTGGGGVKGIANANNIINKTLTREYLQHELNLTLQQFAKTGTNTIVVPANMEGFDMILPTDRLARHRGRPATGLPQRRQRCTT